jgi:hypothetical protein
MICAIITAVERPSSSRLHDAQRGFALFFNADQATLDGSVEDE